MSASFAQRWWQGLDKPGWRNFFVAMAALAVALGLALYSSAAAETGHLWVAGGSALLALGLSIWVGVTIVPTLARRTPLRWLAYHIDYKLTKEGVVYVIGVFVIALAALNTGNNLLFMVLASMLAGIIVSGILSSIVLTGVGLKLELPEHIFAEQPVLATLELENEKLSLPSFSLRVSGEVKTAGKSKTNADSSSREKTSGLGMTGKKRWLRVASRANANDAKAGMAQILSRPVYFPFLPKRRAAQQKVELNFPRRGVYRQDAFGITTKFPFGFLQKTRRVESKMEVVVYPRVEPTEEFYEILPLISGEIESFYRGRGHDLYSIRDYVTTDSARFVDWKATAKTGDLKVREFTREDERRVMLVLDPFGTEAGGANGEKFERAVTLAACLAWHFYEIDSEMQFRTDRMATAMAASSEIIYDVLRELAFIEQKPGAGDGKFLEALTDEPDLFKIILTSQARGSIPTSLWTSSYFVFIQAL
ncbi:MAG: DUF58 domain-containing protein [Acidobacteria bacterium]|nr:DUF58 domain-containing protein [Acidobacteriota bacterium]MBI3663264.1 DUF58 domain-containing protein [Acidobacteriota bacterium]